MLENQTIETFITHFVTNILLQHVGLYWIIQSNQNTNCEIQLHCIFWVLNVPWYNTKVCPGLHDSLFEDYVTTDRRDRYNLMCSIEAHERDHKTINDDASSGGGMPLPSKSKKDVLLSFGLPLTFIFGLNHSRLFICVKQKYIMNTCMIC